MSVSNHDQLGPEHTYIIQVGILQSGKCTAALFIVVQYLKMKIFFDRSAQESTFKMIFFKRKQQQQQQEHPKTLHNYLYRYT